MTFEEEAAGPRAPTDTVFSDGEASESDPFPVDGDIDLLAASFEVG